LYSPTPDNNDRFFPRIKGKKKANAFGLACPPVGVFGSSYGYANLCPEKNQPAKTKGERMDCTKRANAEEWTSVILSELSRAEEKHPEWPADVVHAAAILNEEAGELIQAALDFHCGKGDKLRLIEEATQCGAMALRFLVHLNTYNPQRSITNDQG
jgi:hypothetical protein